ncbi:MAG: PP2C family serine/threonine-protein phosphatase [Caldilineaceae bacterium]
MNTSAQPAPSEPAPAPMDVRAASPPLDEPVALDDASNATAAAESQPDALRWRCVAASVIGVSHQRAGQPLQDAYACTILADGTAVIAVADGAGSAAKAEQGSALAVRAAMAAAQEQLSSPPFDVETTPSEIPWRAFMHHVFEHACGALSAEATHAEVPLRDYATTLLVLVITKTDAACGLIGDCAAVIQTADEELISLCAPQKGEYANMTYFLTQAGALERLDVQVWAGQAQNAAVLSDGLLELALNVAQNRPYAPFFAPLFKFAAAAADATHASSALAEFLNSERINRRTHDDKTLILLSRGGEE